MVAVRRTRGLTEDLAGLATALESIDLRGGELVDAHLEEARDRLVRIIRSYLIPRFETPDGPLLVVFAGPTGSGKSTLVNSLAGIDLSAAGPVRPTTAVPIALGSSAEAGWRVHGVECRLVVGGAPILTRMTLVDTPDIDSTSIGHRVVAERLVDQADIVVFVTSALRYADDIPWEILRRAQSRGATIIPVLNRVGAGTTGILSDFKHRLDHAGIKADPIRLPEHHLGPGAQRVPSLAVRELRRRLVQVVRDRAGHQSQVVNRVINHLFDQVRDFETRVGELSRGIETTAGEIRRSFSDIAALHPDVGRHARLDFTPLPGRRFGRWRRRNQPRPTELRAWETTLRNRLVADLESGLRRALADVGAPILALGHTLSDLGADARRMLADAVDGWLEEVHDRCRGDTHPRLSVLTTIAAALHPVDEKVTYAVLGDHHLDRVGSARRSFESRLRVVHSHHGERLEEAWRMATGSPETEDIGSSLAAVASAYQFADG